MLSSWEFIKAVGHHWVTLMSGGIVTVGVGLVERITKHPMPIFVYVIVIATFVVFGCFLAWRDEHAKITKLEMEASDGLLEMRREAVQQEWDRFTDVQKAIARHLLIMARQDIVDRLGFIIVSRRRGEEIERDDWDRVSAACFVEHDKDEEPDDFQTLSIRPEFIKALELVVRDNKAMVKREGN